MSCDRHTKKSTYPIERKWNNSRMVPIVVEEDGDAQHFFPRVSSVVWSMPESIRSFVEECYLSALNFSKVSVVVFCGFKAYISHLNSGASAVVIRQGIVHFRIYIETFNRLFSF